MANVSKFTIRTSGRRTFRRCMRKWGFQSSMRMNLEKKGAETNINFWFGSAIHFAMEDYFGHNKFGDLQKAFQAYYAAFPAYDRPNGADEHYYLGMGMLDYFRDWYKKHNAAYGFETVWLNADKQEVEPGTPGAEPLIEQSFLLDLGVKVWIRDDTEEIMFGSDAAFYATLREEHADICIFQDRQTGRYYFEKDPVEHPDDGGTAWEAMTVTRERVYLSQVPIMYHGTLDRVVRDRQGRWWIMDWKTAKGADTNKLDADDQISAYLWAAEQWFGRPIHGFMYVQLTKDVPKPPKRLGSGAMSVDKKQKTTYALARAEIIKDYGEVRKAPAKTIEFLNNLAAEETPEGDRYIRWDAVFRTKEQKISTYHHILGEVRLMTDPDLYLYPSPTRDCIWDCNFRDACLKMDNGQREQAMIELDVMYEQRPREEDGNIDSWRVNIPWPDSENYGKAIGSLVELMEFDAGAAMDIILPDKYKNLEDDER